MTQEPNLSKIELIATALGPLRDRDGRPGLLEEARNAPADLRAYLAARFAELLAAPDFLDVLPALIFPDESLAERTQVVTERIGLLAQQRTDKS